MENYNYLTGNEEFVIRINRGENYEKVSDEITAKWTPGNEYLWDGINAESLINTDEKSKLIVNMLLYTRIMKYRKLLSEGKNIKGTDPLQYE